MLELDAGAASSNRPAAPGIASVRPNGRAAPLLALGALLFGLAGLALAIDLPLARYFADSELPGELRRLLRLSEAFAWGGTVALIVLAAALLDPRGWRVMPRLLICSLGTGLLANFVKLLIGRSRPSAASLDGAALGTFVAWLPAWRAEALELKYGHALQSFPSGHAATAAGLAVGLSMLYPRGRWLFIALAILAALQRIEAQAHFASDVLAGAGLACLVGAACELPGPLSRWLSRLER